MSIYYYKSLEKKMAIRATLQTKLACGVLLMIITNICILIAIIAYVSREEMCKLKIDDDKNKKNRSINLTAINFRTTIGEFPWMTAFLIFPDEIFIGTAVIVSQRWAITTAHSIQEAATYPTSKKGFRGGSTFWNNYGFYHQATNIVTHKKFNPSTLDYNIALVKVIQPFVNPNEAPASLAKIQFKAVNITEVIGWASFNNNPKNIMNNLLRVNVELITEQLCKKTLERSKSDSSTFRLLCTHKKTEKSIFACEFSSGSALFVNGLLIGLTSSSVMCNESHLPGIYVNLTTITDWIEKIIQ